MYVYPNFGSKKQLKEAIQKGKPVEIFSPGAFSSPQNGIASVEGPHYPQPHRWYACVEVKDGMIARMLA